VFTEEGCTVRGGGRTPGDVEWLAELMVQGTPAQRVAVAMLARVTRIQDTEGAGPGQRPCEAGLRALAQMAVNAMSGAGALDAAGEDLLVYPLVLCASV
jgi:hypothetical protein